MSRIQRSVSTLSWIDPKLYGLSLPKVDPGNPGPMLPRPAMFATNLDFFRFSNFLEAWIDLDKNNQIAACGFSAESGMYQAPSFLQTESVQVGDVGRCMIRSSSAVTFRQIVGCRTMAPEKIARTVTTILAGPILGPLGQDAAELIKIFPPIWSELELTINVNGSYSSKLLRHSVFPSLCYYAAMPKPNEFFPDLYQCFSYYNGIPALKLWEANGWGPVAVPLGGAGSATGNPWSMTKPATRFYPPALINRPPGY
jgi:hypothetical protein